MVYRYELSKKNMKEARKNSNKPHYKLLIFREKEKVWGIIIEQLRFNW